MNFDSAGGGEPESAEGATPLSRSPRIAARQLEARRRILEATRLVVAEQGFAAAQVAVVASLAEVATGTIYRHFPSKASLFSEMLRQVCHRELEVVRSVLDDADLPASTRIADAVRTFVDRALRGGGLSYAVIVEPMDPDIDRVRLDARAALAEAFARAISDGIDSGQLPAQAPRLRGAAIVGAFLEAVVAPLDERPVPADIRDSVSRETAAFCRSAVSGSTAVRETSG